MAEKTVLVTGAGGTVSTALMEAFAGRPELQIRALLHSETKAETLQKLAHDVVVADLEEPDTLDRAFTGVNVLWLLTPSSPLAPSMTSNAIRAARRAGVGHVVRMSALKAGHDAPTRNGRLHSLSDEELKASGIAWTILRPHYFMQNLLGSAASIASQGSLFLNMGDAPVGMIDARDIGALAAKIIENPAPHSGRTYTLTGPQKLTLAQAAETLGQVLAKAVNYMAIPSDTARDTMLGFGMPRWLVGALVEYGEAYSQGWGDFVTTDFQTITGREPRAFAKFAADFAPAFGGSPTSAAHGA